jgi:hypothetical protein
MLNSIPIKRAGSQSRRQVIYHLVVERDGLDGFSLVVVDHEIVSGDVGAVPVGQIVVGRLDILDRALTIAALHVHPRLVAVGLGGLVAVLKNLGRDLVGFVGHTLGNIKIVGRLGRQLHAFLHGQLVLGIDYGKHRPHRVVVRRSSGTMRQRDVAVGRM